MRIPSSQTWRASCSLRRPRACVHFVWWISRASQRYWTVGPPPASVAMRDAGTLENGRDARPEPHQPSEEACPHVDGALWHDRPPLRRCRCRCGPHMINFAFFEREMKTLDLNPRRFDLHARRQVPRRDSKKHAGAPGAAAHIYPGSSCGSRRPPSAARMSGANFFLFQWPLTARSFASQSRRNLRGHF